MNGDHWILVGGWCLFGLLHSVTADTRFRRICQAGMGHYACYYRLLYSFLAMGSLAGVLLWQFSIPSPVIGTFPLLKYLFSLLLIWSLFLFFPLLSNLAGCIIITLYTFAGIRLEERKLLLRFGSVYADYCRRTPMLIPRFRSIFPLR